VGIEVAPVGRVASSRLNRGDPTSARGHWLQIPVADRADGYHPSAHLQARESARARPWYQMYVQEMYNLRLWLVRQARRQSPR
jgi:hypothetical protein